jgi:hypothetical protein
MVPAGLTESGAEEWLCPVCDRRILLKRPPRFEMLVVDEGDSAATHAGAKGGVLMGTAVVQAPSSEVSPDERRWLRSNGIDWDGIAS